MFLASFAVNAAVFPADGDSVALAPELAYLEDPGGKLTIESVRSGNHAEAFQAWGRASAFNQGYTDSTYWLRFSLEAPAGAPEKLLLEARYFSLDSIAVYTPDGRRLAQGLIEDTTGATWPHRYPVFELDPPARAGTYYVQVSSRGSLTAPLTVWDPAAFAAHTQQRYFVETLYFGGLFALVLFNFLLFLAVRDTRYLLYVLFAACLGVGMLSVYGLGGQFIWPKTFFWNALTSDVALSLAGFFGTLFAQSFLATRYYTPRLHHGLSLLAAIFLGNTLLVGLGLYPAPSQVLSLAAPTVSILALIAGGLAYRRGNRGARFFLLAWSVLLVSTAFAGLRNLGWVPTNIVTMNSLAVGSALEMVLLALALADRINQERALRVAAQNEALAARQNLVDSLAASERQLEDKVAERTAALRHSLAHQRTILEEYVRFGAFLAHELRNPLSIIQSQAALAQKEAQTPQGDPIARLDAISGAASRLKVLFDEWLASDRLQQAGIGPEPQPVSLPPWLTEWTAVAAGGHSDHHIAVAPAPEPNAMVAADDSLLRIVLFNLIDNACKYAPAGSTVTVRPEIAATAAGFSVIDQGPGMDDATQARIFERYRRDSTTSPEKGLGLGLALVKQIATSHGGTIEVASRPGEGSRLTIWLPRADADSPQLQAPKRAEA